MRIKVLLLTVLCMSQVTVAQNVNSTASAQEQSQVVASFQRPANTIARLLKQVLMDVRSEIGSQPIQVKILKTSVANHFDFEIRALNSDSSDGVLITGEVLVRQGTAYVFHFNTERLVMAQKWPGVGMGTR